MKYGAILCIAHPHVFLISPGVHLCKHSPSRDTVQPIRIINPTHKSKFVTKVWHDVRERFELAETLKLKLIETFEDKLLLFMNLVWLSGTTHGGKAVD